MAMNVPRKASPTSRNPTPPPARLPDVLSRSLPPSKVATGDLPTKLSSGHLHYSLLPACQGGAPPCHPDTIVLNPILRRPQDHRHLPNLYSDDRPRLLPTTLPSVAAPAKNSVALSRRLLNKELDPVVIVNMSHNELKDGLTAEEKTTKEPEESKRVQMTDARCSTCTEKKVCIAEIIHGDRYQLKCMVCGYAWYASHDAISSLTIDTPSVAGNVGTAPGATAKFEDVERKKLVSSRDSKKPDVDSSIHTSVRGAEII